MAGTTVSKGKRPLRALSASDKIEAIQRVNDGESKASVARQIGVPESTLRGWCKNEDKLRYMSSRHSTPDTDKSSDGIVDNGIPEKRTKYDLSSVAVNYSHTTTSQYSNGVDALDTQAMDHNGLDLSRLKESTDRDSKSVDIGINADYSQYAKSSLDIGKGISELSKSTDIVNNMLSKENNKLKIDPGANISMTAISPLSTLNNISGMTTLGQNHLGMSFNEIATNLSLIAQLNPSFNTLANSINSNAKMLRSIRSPKPGLSTGNSTNNGISSVDKQIKSDRKTHTHSDTYSDKSRTRSNNSSYKDHQVDDALWYWFKKQQAMLNLAAANTTAQLPMPLPHSMNSSRNSTDAHSRNSNTSLPPTLLPPTLDKNSWFWKYYQQVASNLGLQDIDKIKSNLKQENYENLLYSHLTKEKFNENFSPEPQPQENHTDTNDKMEDKTSSENEADTEAEIEVDADPEVVNGRECISPSSAEKLDKESKNQIKVRAVLDNLLLLNNNNVPIKDSPVAPLDDTEKDSNTENEFSCEVNEALEHGEKFLKWLESCQEPSVTRMQVHQLKGLLNNIKANVSRRNQECINKDRISRRK